MYFCIITSIPLLVCACAHMYFSFKIKKKLVISTKKKFKKIVSNLFNAQKKYKVQ